MSNEQSREIEPRAKSELVTEDTRPGFVFRPDVDILERPDAYVIHADLPGVAEDAVDIHLDKGVLTLDARFAEETGERRPVHVEYRAGGYHREFRISEDVDPTRVAAKMKDGVLELLLPKTAERQPRRITVEAA
ncbi:MAG TPA: Hsp20/alpha crystallin family protein [Myxococcota bacterium]|nr:Hsp20/alpha crystallin family protein [Myxococcota bacterium]